MIKTIMLAGFLMAFTFIAIPASSAYAHCGKCPKTEKPCEKTLEKKKPCEKKLGEKKPCDKKMDKKPCDKKMKKPCTKSLKGKTSSSYKDHSAKGSLTFKSGSPISSRGTSSYND